MVGVGVIRDRMTDGSALILENPLFIDIEIVLDIYPGGHRPHLVEHAAHGLDVAGRDAVPVEKRVTLGVPTKIVAGIFDGVGKVRFQRHAMLDQGIILRKVEPSPVASHQVLIKGTHAPDQKAFGKIDRLIVVPVMGPVPDAFRRRQSAKGPAASALALVPDRADVAAAVDISQVKGGRQVEAMDHATGQQDGGQAGHQCEFH